MLTAYLNFGPWGGPYQTVKVDEVKQTDVPRSGQTQTGYGTKVPTSYMIRYEKQWRRVYVTIFSNSGTLWARVSGVRVVVRVDDFND
jgi:hypothetical protein